MRKYFFLILLSYLGLSTSAFGQRSEDNVVGFLREFYENYISNVCYEDGNANYIDFLQKHDLSQEIHSSSNGKVIVEEFCTEELFSKIAALSKAYVLDYDPFINGQDCCDGLYYFTITATPNIEWFLMCYYNESEKKEVLLKVVEESGSLKIANLRVPFDDGVEDILDLFIEGRSIKE